MTSQALPSCWVSACIALLVTCLALYFAVFHGVTNRIPLVFTEHVASTNFAVHHGIRSRTPLAFTEHAASTIAIPNARNADVVHTFPGPKAASHLANKSLAMIRSRPTFQACFCPALLTRVAGGCWARYCSCERNLEVAGRAAKICHIPVYGVILTLYEPLHSKVLYKVGDEIERRGEYKTLFTAPPLGVGGTVLDIGSNLGDVSILLAKLNPLARVFAFEANPTTFKFLRQNVEANGVEAQVTILNLAVMSSDGKILSVFDCHGNNFGGATVKAAYAAHHFRSTKKCGAQRVPSISFPTILKTFQIGKVDLLKMDCEGCEEDVIPQIAAGTVLRQSGECHGKVYEKPAFLEVCRRHLEQGVLFGY